MVEDQRHTDLGNEIEDFEHKQKGQAKRPDMLVDKETAPMHDNYSTIQLTEGQLYTLCLQRHHLWM